MGHLPDNPKGKALITKYIKKIDYLLPSFYSLEKDF
jgi:hypothetical protein